MMTVKASKKMKTKEFSANLVKKVEKRYPVSLDVGQQRKISERKLTKILESVYREANEFKSDNKLWIYGKAQLINEFRWGLKELGYSEAFIEVASGGLTVYLSKK